MDQSLAERRRNDGRLLWMVCSALAGLALGVGLMWWGVFVYHDRSQADVISRLNEQVFYTTTQLNELRTQSGVLEGKLAVERSTRQGLERTLGTVQQELGAARDQIAFFYELLPPGPDGSISIRGFDMQQQGNLLSFRVLLMRHGARDQPFSGRFQFQAAGTLHDEPLTVTLEPARAPDPDNPSTMSAAIADGRGTEADGSLAEKDADLPSTSALTLKFDQFQRSSGLLQIPEGMEIESVTLNVLEGETLRVSRTVDIPVQAPVH